MRTKAAAEAAGDSSAAALTRSEAADRCSQSWAMLIKRVYELDPLTCPECGGQMAVVAFIEPPQAEVIEKILNHCGLSRSSAARAPPSNAHRDGMDGYRRSDSERARTDVRGHGHVPSVSQLLHQCRCSRAVLEQRWDVTLSQLEPVVVASP